MVVMVMVVEVVVLVVVAVVSAPGLLVYNLYLTDVHG